MLLIKKHNTLYIDEGENMTLLISTVTHNHIVHIKIQTQITTRLAINEDLLHMITEKPNIKLFLQKKLLEWLKNNKEEIQNLRIIFEGNLVEYEVRDNGSIYAIYRSLEPITLEGIDYKNVGYAPWKRVIQAAEKIYWTDEYDISQARSRQIPFYEPLRPGDSNYNQHQPYSPRQSSFYSRNTRYRKTSRA